MPDTVPNAFETVQIILLTTLVRPYYCAHSTDEGTEARNAICQSPRAGYYFQDDI